MRNSSGIRKKDSIIPWKWIVVVVVIFVVLYVLRWLGSGTSENPGKWIVVSWSWTFVVTKKDGTKKDVALWEKFYESDSLFSVISGTAELTDSTGKFFLDKNSELIHSDSNSGWFLLSQWRMWIESSKDFTVSLKHIDVKLSEWDVVLLEQQRIYSIVYVMQWDVTIEWSGRQTVLKSWKRIMVSQSNLINPSVTLESLLGDIDESIQQNAFFLARNGKTYLDNVKLSPSEGTLSWTVGGMLNSWALSSQANGNKFIMITSPVDGASISWWLLIVEWKTLSPQVKKIVINDQSVQVSQSPWNFRSQAIPVSTSTLDLVYRVYDANNNLLDRWVITVFSSEKQNGTEKLVPKTFPTSDKDFRILSPNENPYKTTQWAVTVSWTVPKWAVEYITVNNFRLKKFTPNSTNWYYYANTSYQTMKEWFNLYEIRFYWPNDTLLSTQLFTIIKEWGKTVSWE